LKVYETLFIHTFNHFEVHKCNLFIGFSIIHDILVSCCLSILGFCSVLFILFSYALLAVIFSHAHLLAGSDKQGLSLVTPPQYAMDFLFFFAIYPQLTLYHPDRVYT
jgi:hypothetical protein